MKLLCLVGWHNWTWKLPKSGSIEIEDGVDVRCGYCDAPYIEP